MPCHLRGDVLLHSAHFVGAYSSQLLAVEEMPKPGTTLSLEVSSLIAELLFCWVIQLQLPLMYVVFIL